MITYKPHQFQREFHQSPARFRALIAGRRGGKTLAGTIEALKYADSHPNSIGWVVAPTYVMLKDVNIPLFKDFIPRSSIRDWNQSLNTITLVNGARISFRTAEDPDRLRGIGLDWLWLDEACFMKPGVWEVLYPALTDKEGIAWVTTTPKGYDWVYKKFYQESIRGNEEYKVWKYRTIDNPHINQAMVEEARKTMSEVMFRQEYMASFEKFEGLVYPDFEEHVHVIEPKELDRDDLFFVAIDPGYTNPNATLLVAEDQDKNLYVVDERYKTQQTVLENANDVKSLVGGRPIELYLIDPSSKNKQQTSELSIWQQYVEAGIPLTEGVSEANNDVRAGIDRMTQYIRPDEKTKQPRLYIFKNCVNLIRELQGYSWKEIKDGSTVDERPMKVNDHAVDALRYVVMSRPEEFTRVQRDSYGRKVPTYEQYLAQQEGMIDML